jgi:hypothetical protein
MPDHWGRIQEIYTMKPFDGTPMNGARFSPKHVRETRRCDAKSNHCLHTTNNLNDCSRGQRWN